MTNQPDRTGGDGLREALTETRSALFTILSASAKRETHGLNLPWYIEQADKALAASGADCEQCNGSGRDTARFKHAGRGTIYVKIGEAQVQADVPLTNYELVTVYVLEGSSPPEYWVRRNSEFNDGRFIRQAPHSSREGGR